MIQVTVIFNDWEQIYSTGFFSGYNYIVWTVVGLQAGGGLVCELLSAMLSSNPARL